MIQDKKISVIIPCRNEENALSKLLERIPNYIDEVLIVDNLSTDRTVTVGEKFGVNIITEPRTKNGIGYGYALASGISSAGGDIFVCLDGDGTYPPEEIGKIIKFLLTKNVDFISCNRLFSYTNQERSLIRALGVHILNSLIWLLYGYRIKDSLSGMWVFRKNILPLLKLYDGGWNFSEEIKLEAITNSKISFTEYAIPYKDRLYNKSKLNILQAGISYLLYLFLYKFFTRRPISSSYSKGSLLKVQI